MTPMAQNRATFLATLTAAGAAGLLGRTEFRRLKTAGWKRRQSESGEPPTASRPNCR